MKASDYKVIAAVHGFEGRGMVDIVGVASRDGKNRTLAATPVSLKSMDGPINRQIKPNSALF
jgi:hypothetical protein